MRLEYKEDEIKINTNTNTNPSKDFLEKSTP